MFIDPAADEKYLRQGDICRDVPIPIITGVERLADMKTHAFLPGSVPTEEMLASRSNIGIGFQLVRSTLVVLSQSCDLEEATRSENARILVAPTVKDDDERFMATYARATKDATEKFALTLLTRQKDPKSFENESGKVRSAVESSREKGLKDIWLGHAEGVFPVAAHPGHSLQRSICYFDNAVSLPASWLPLLLKRRVLHLKDEWAAVLREKLAAWLGRYGFPGSKDERLAVGGLGSPAPQAADAPADAQAPAPNSGK